WTNLPVPEVLQNLPVSQQQQVISWADALVKHKTEGFEELYNAIGMIVKYIPNFVVIPLMVEHIKPRIAAGVCAKMGVDQAVGYANDLPVEYFNEVSLHLEASVMAQILEKMKKNNAERFIISELRSRLDRMLDIAQHLDKRMLEIVGRHVTLPENEEELLNHPRKPVFDKIRALQ
ncbi:MAG: hypothetical protein HGB23_11265, partial [Chlorobiaceae bacterium]|nr:hypothetical protein [Chlorobiaceae bacterium]